ncbi:helix-turn-helix domain-containing protein [Streptomyces sp. NBC_01803]|uniref:helix-turn-helix domain-containing protein n=1 Tax=Streptomyces sp. NBC_01803 TaxID=2975946 RepID=UPI002DD92C47|nr:helix-turn-helix domain-containing protein [Streptomyces sp. NBC_01803]WSA45550.1 helix-turn-helix domain-containing protein [Streptomyces sp. NBC_01803]
MPRTEAVITQNPWRDLPPALAALLRPRLAAIEAEIISSIRGEVDTYRQPLNSAMGRDLVATVRRALEQFVELIENPDSPQGHHADFFQRLGRLEFLNGRSTDLLQAAYRVGARVAARQYVAVARAASFPEEVLFTLNDAVLAHISTLSEEAVKGYSSAMAKTVGDMPRARRLLAERLLEPGPANSAEPVELLAARAKWVWPERVACVVLPGLTEAPAGLDEEILVLRRGNVLHLIAPDPDAGGRANRLRQLLGDGTPAVLGPTVPPERASISLHCARLTLTLLRRSSRGPQGVVDATDHLVDVHLLNGAPVGHLVADRALLPLQRLTPGKAARLSETLDALLMSWRRTAPEVAEALHIHPQTARYRIRQLEDLFGTRLTDPAFRFQAMLALRTRALEVIEPRR